MPMCDWNSDVCSSDLLGIFPTLRDPVNYTVHGILQDTILEYTGVGCHFLLQGMKVKSENEVTQSCPTLCDPMNRSTPGLPVHHQLPEFTQTHVHRVSDAIQPMVKNLPANAGETEEIWFQYWAGKIPWRTVWQSTPVFLPGESPWMWPHPRGSSRISS